MKMKNVLMGILGVLACVALVIVGVIIIYIMFMTGKLFWASLQAGDTINLVLSTYAFVGYVAFAYLLSKLFGG